MSLLTKPSALTSASRVIYTLFNTIYDDLYNKIGHTVSGRGTLTWENLSATAEIAATQIANTAAVLGGGAVQEMVNAFRQTAPYLETATANVGTMSNTGAAGTIASGKLFQLTNNADTITTLLGGTEDQEIYLVIIHAGKTITHSTTDTLNVIHLKADNSADARSSLTAGGAATDPTILRLIYTKLGATFANLQWVEL